MTATTGDVLDAQYRVYAALERHIGAPLNETERVMFSGCLNGDDVRQRITGSVILSRIIGEKGMAELINSLRDI